MRQYLNRRFIVILATLVALFLLASYLVYNTVTSTRQDLAEKSALLLVKSVRESISGYMNGDLHRISSANRTKMRRLLSNLATSDGNILSILIIDTVQTIRLSNDRRVEGSTYRAPEQVRWLQTQELLLQHQTWQDDLDVIDVIMPLTNDEDKIFAYLRVVLSAKEINQSLTGLPQTLIPLFVAFAILFIVSLIFTTKVYRKPLERINQAITKMNEEDYTYRVNYGQSDEFTDTFAKLNRTIEKVGVLKEGYKKAEKRIVSLLQSVNESVLIVDTQKHVTSFNDATANFFNIDAPSFEDFFEEILHTNVELNNLLSKTLKSGYVVSEKQLAIFLPNEDEILTRMSIQPLQEDDVIHGAVLTFRDQRMISELENNLLRSMKFGVITNLASSISHEIKNPLSALALHTEVLDVRLQKLEFKEKNQVMKSLDTLQNEVKRLNRIIHQFLTLARPSKLELSLIEINDVVKEVLQLVQQQSQEKTIKINATLAPKLEKVYGDPDQLKQVLLNILLNAFAATDPGGEVFVRTRKEKRMITVDIRDTGSGIPKDAQKKIFDLYFTTKKDGGGIGLSVCKNIMEAHDGSIFFETVEKEGTIFSIQLPIKDPTTIRSTRVKPVRRKKKPVKST